MINLLNNESINILLADDEFPSLDLLEEIVRTVLPKANIFSVNNYIDALDIAKEHLISVAILDIEMPGITGIELGNQLKDLYPKINIIFLTAYDAYAYDAAQLFCSGYLLKPISKKAVIEQFMNLRYQIENEVKTLRIQCFGNFDVYYDEKPVQFERSKGKEMLAYLVDRRGARVTSGELVAHLYEDSIDEQKNRTNLYSAWHALKKALKNIGFEDLVIHSQNAYAVNTSMIDCDYYRYLDGDESAKVLYRGQYMYQYSWAEYTFKEIE